MDNSIKKVDIIILGAGISGLTLGYHLHKKNRNFLVFDSNKTKGGNILTKISDDYVCENGPNTLLLNNHSIKNLISELDLEKEIIYPNTNNNKRFLIKNGKLIEIPRSFGEFLNSNILSLNAKIRVFIEIFFKKSVRNTSVYEFFKRRFGKEFHDKLIEPFLTGVYAGNSHNMSIKHVLNKIWKMEQEYGSIIIGFIKNKAGNKMPKSFNFKSGLSELTNKIYLKIKDKINFKSRITSISKVGNLYEITINDNTKYQCDKLISTIPAYALSEIIYDNKLAQTLKKVSYCPIHVIHVGLDKEKIKEDINGFGVLTKQSDKKNFLGIIFNSRIFPHVAPKGIDLITVMIGGTRQAELIKLDKELLFNKILKDVRQLISYEGEVLMRNEFTWKRGIPQYDLNHESVISGVENFLIKNKNFHILGNYINGISVSDCVEKAWFLSEKL